MAKPDTPPGLSKTHTATRTNPDTGATESKDFTQQEWKDRDKSEGWTRPDEADDLEPLPEPAGEEPPSGGTI